MTLVYLVACFLSGVFLGLIPFFWSSEALLLLAASVALIAILCRHAPATRLLLVCLIAILLGIVRGQAGVPRASVSDVSRFIGQGTVRLRGQIVEPPDVRDTRTNLRVQVSSAENARGAPVDGMLQVSVARYPEYRYGDVLELAGELEAAPIFEDFSYRDYLARQGVYAVMYRPRVTVLQSDAGNPLLATLYGLKTWAEAVLARSVPEPQAALAAGVLLGAKRSLPADLAADLQTTGLTHMVVVSGMNLSIVAALLQRVSTRRLGRKRSLVLAVAGIVCFTLLVGPSAAVIRAALMVTLGLVAVVLGRQNGGVTAVAAAAGAMVAWQPVQLLDVGFQLSVAATLGMVWLSPVLETRLARLPAGLRADLALALAAQVMTLPIIADNFGRVSVIGPIANLAVLWAVPLLMAVAFLTVLVGWLPIVAGVIGWGVWAVGGYMVLAVQALAGLPAASIVVPAVDAYWWVLYYAAILLIVRRTAPPNSDAVASPAKRAGTLRRWLPVGALSVAAVLMWAAVLAQPDGRFHVWFLDVGEGDATLIRTPRGQTILVDGGPSPSAISTALGRTLPFWQREVDLLVLTHANEDHLLGLVDVAKRYRVAQVMDSPRDSRTPTFVEWERMLAAGGIARTPAETGQSVDLGDGGLLQVIAAGSGGSENEGSTVLRLTMGNVSVLLPGDIDAATARMLSARRVSLSATVLKVPHHGSRTGLDDAVLEAVAPRAAVISAGAGNLFGHPAPETLELLRGLPVYRTDTQGTIELVADGSGWTIRGER